MPCKQVDVLVLSLTVHQAFDKNPTAKCKSTPQMGPLGRKECIDDVLTYNVNYANVQHLYYTSVQQILVLNALLCNEPLNSIT